jgi:tyrosine-protein phosphatase SIW14
MTRRTSLSLAGGVTLLTVILLYVTFPAALAAKAPTTHRAGSRPAHHVSTRPLATPSELPGVGGTPGVPNFAQVAPGLYRGAQPTAEGFAALKKMGVKTVIDLRSMHSDRDKLKGLGLRYAEIPCFAWHPEDEDVARFLKLVADPANQPIFVHCAQGADRTGYMVAAYRMVEQGWSADDARQEMTGFHFHPLWTEITEYLGKFDAAKMRQRAADAKPPKVETVE